jgi:hypothetical protein
MLLWEKAAPRGTTLIIQKCQPTTMEPDGTDGAYYTSFYKNI